MAPNPVLGGNYEYIDLITLHVGAEDKVQAYYELAFQHLKQLGAIFDGIPDGITLVARLDEVKNQGNGLVVKEILEEMSRVKKMQERFKRGEVGKFKGGYGDGFFPPEFQMN
jgi:hypothetical protein